jgi:hypothetical protein
VDYATADGTATAGSDYVAASGQLSFAPGETSQPVTVVVNGDGVEESDETFFVDLSNAVNATIGDSLGTGTIIDDDGTGPVTVSFQDGIDGYTGTRDTKMKSGSPTANYGGDTKLEIDGSPDESSILSWDLASIPPGSAIQSVDITVNVTNGSSHSYELYELLRPWVEGEVTWNEYAIGQSWQVAGADGSGDRGSTVLGIVTGAVGVTTISLNSDGAAVVQSWVDNPSSNNGFVCLDYISASNGMNFSSREIGTVSERPKLTVTYSSSSQAKRSFVSTSELEETEPSGVILPEAITLNPNYPNPFNLETSIEYALPEQGQVRLTVYNVRGQQVRLLVDENQPAGFKRVLWNGRDDFGHEVGSGVYLIHLLMDRQSLVRKISLLK